MSVAFTSRMAYKAVQDDLSGLCREVWEAIRDWQGAEGPSIEDLSKVCRRKVSSICGRVSELRAAGAIQDAPLKMGPSGVQVKTYRAVVWQEPIPTGQLQLW